MINLKPHQKEGKQYLQERGSGFLFWKPRVGKTYPSLEVVLESEVPILILTKNSIMETFRKALINDYGFPEEEVGVCRTNYSKDKKKKIIQNHSIVLCNYQSVVPLRIISAREWKSFIFDESYALANLDAKVTRYIYRAMMRQADDSIRIALTGTPASESPLQYATQFFIVDGQYMGYNDIHEYVADEWKPTRNGGKMVPQRVEHLKEIKAYVQEHASCLSMEDVGLGSEIFYNQRFVHLNHKQKELLEWAEGRKKELNKCSHILDSNPGLGSMVYAGYENMIASGINPLTKEIINYNKINDVLECYWDNPEPMLVLSWYVDLLPAAVKIFKEAGVKCEFIDGTLVKTEAEEIRQRFQDGYLDVVFGQSAVVGEGLDFSRANITYYLNNFFGLNVREQTSMRTTNVDKTTPVEIIDICAVETFEYKVVQKLNRKEKISNEFLKANGRL